MTRLLATVRVMFAIALVLSTSATKAQMTADCRESSCAQAEAFFRDYRYEEASKVFLEMLASDSTNYLALTRSTESLNLWGLDLQAAEKKDSARVVFEEAVRYAEQTRRHYADSARTFVNLAVAYGNLALFRGGKDKVRIGRDVERYCDNALLIDPDNMVALTVMGVFHRELSKLSWIERLVAKTLYGGLPAGSIDKSVEFLQKAIEADSTALFPNYSLAITYRRMKDEGAALAQFERVLDLHPRNSEEERYRTNAMTWLEDARQN